MNVTAKARSALCVVMTASEVVPESGYAWELDLVGDGQTTRRLMVVLPPGLPLQRAQQPGQFLDVARALPAFDGLETADLSDNTLVLARSEATSWVGFGCAIQNDLGYWVCFMNAMDRFKEEWDSEACAATGFASEERFRRDASLEINGVLERFTLRAGHRILRSRVVQRYLTWIEDKFGD